MRERTSVVAAVILAWGLASHASAEVVPLKELEKRALARHSLVQAGAARERAAAATVREAESAYKPRIGMSVDSNIAPGRQIVQVASVDKEGVPDGDTFSVQGVNALNRENNEAFIPKWRSTMMVTLGVNLYDFGRTSAAVAASRSRHEASKVQQDLSKAEVIANVRVAYLTWLSTHELHVLSANATTDGARRSERVQGLVQEGARPRAELAPVEADRLLAELELERSNGDLETARVMLEHAVGEPLSPTAEPDPSVLDLQPNQAPAQSRSADPALRLLVHQRAALDATARMQRKEGYPVISATAGVGVGVQLPETTVLPSYAAGLAMSIPLWDGGGNQAAADATEAQADELRLQLESTESDRNFERQRADLDAQHALARQRTAEKLREVCAARVTDVEAGYELGAMQFEQVQQARSMLRRAETEVVLARVARAEAILRFAP